MGGRILCFSWSHLCFLFLHCMSSRRLKSQWKRYWNILYSVGHHLNCLHTLHCFVSCRPVRKKQHINKRHSWTVSAYLMTGPVCLSSLIATPWLSSQKIFLKTCSNFTTVLPGQLQSLHCSIKWFHLGLLCCLKTWFIPWLPSQFYLAFTDALKLSKNQCRTPHDQKDT